MYRFDRVVCQLPLPWPDMQDKCWLSLNTPAQAFELYEIRRDGSLWNLDLAEAVAESDQFTEIDRRWIFVSDFDGPLQLLLVETTEQGDPEPPHEIIFWMRGGVVRDAIFRYLSDSVSRASTAEYSARKAEQP